MERRVRHHVVRPARKAQIARVALHHDHAVVAAREQPAEVVGSPGIPFHCDHARAEGHEWTRERSGSRADVDDDRASGEARVSDEVFCPAGVELVPPPAPWRGHGDAPSRSRSCGHSSRRARASPQPNYLDWRLAAGGLLVPQPAPREFPHRHGLGECAGRPHVRDRPRRATSTPAEQAGRHFGAAYFHGSNTDAHSIPRWCSRSPRRARRFVELRAPR